MLRDYSGDTLKVRDELTKVRETLIRQQDQIDSCRATEAELKEHLKEVQAERLVRLDKQKDLENRLKATEEIGFRNAVKIAEREKEDALTIKARNTELEQLYDKLKTSESRAFYAIVAAVVEGLAIVAVALLK